MDFVHDFYISEGYKYKGKKIMTKICEVGKIKSLLL